ncbi:MAG: hypothetical protein ACQEXQ_16290 [Bacillota bacterium]
MQSLAKSGYSAEQVKAALHASNRKIAFRYELLDSQNRIKASLTNVISGSVSNNALADIKRTARFSLREDGSINFLSDRIKPFVRLWIPPGRVLARQYAFIQRTQPVLYQTIQEAPETGGWVEWPLGVFVLSTPPRKVDAVGVVTREVEAYDLLQVLKDDKVTDRYTVAAGTNYVTAVKALLDGAGLTTQNLTATNLTLPTARDWAPGTEKLRIINDLLGAINYRSIFFDEDGQAVAQPYVSPADRASEYTYRDDQDSVIFPEIEQSLDLFAIANKFTLVVSEPDRTPLVSTYTNTNPSSPTSTVSRGRTIVDYREQQEAADQASLDAKVQRIAFEASQVYESVEFETAIMPQHSDLDVYTLEFTGLGISAKYSEQSWEMPLKSGSRMKHRIRRVVSI